MYDIDWRHWIHISNITTCIINKASLRGVYQEWAHRCVAHCELPLWGIMGIPVPGGLSSRVRVARPRVGRCLAVRFHPDIPPGPYPRGLSVFPAP